MSDSVISMNSTVSLESLLQSIQMLNLAQKRELQEHLEQQIFEAEEADYVEDADFSLNKPALTLPPPAVNSIPPSACGQLGYGGALFVGIIATLFADGEILDSAVVYADLLVATFAIHCFELYKKLNWPLPKSQIEEQHLAAQLNTYLARGYTRENFQYPLSESEVRIAVILTKL